MCLRCMGIHELSRGLVYSVETGLHFHRSSVSDNYFP